MARAGSKLVGGLLLVALILPASPAAAETVTFYLGTDGFPRGSLVPNLNGGEMPNFDRGRDIHPGLQLEESSLGLAETDEKRYQQWDTAIDPGRVTGYPTVTLWAAAEAFDPAARIEYTVFLLDCTRFGHPCVELGQGRGTIRPGEGGVWARFEVPLPYLDHTFAADRRLGVRVVVDQASTAGLMLAFGYPAYRSRLAIAASPPTAGEEPTATAPAPAPDSPRPRLSASPATGEEPAPAEEAGPDWLVTAGLNGLLLAGLGSVLVAWLLRPGARELSRRDASPGTAPRR